MNPGTLVRPDPIDSNLRFAALGRPAGSGPVDVEFTYPGDGGDFVARREPLRGSGQMSCLGGRRGRRFRCHVPVVPGHRGGADSTRGRARVLHEMARGTRVADGVAVA